MDDSKANLKADIKHQSMQSITKSEGTSLLAVGNARYTEDELRSSGIIEIFDEESKSWRLYYDMENDVTDYSAVILGDNLLRICGNAYNNNTNQVSSLNLKTLQMSKMPATNVQRDHLTANVIKENVYVCGGWVVEDATDSLEVWNPSLSNWIQLPPMKYKRNGHASAVYDNKLYIFGGYSRENGFLRTAEYYDPEKYTWSDIAPMDGPVSDVTATVVDNKIYVIGGQTPDSKSIDKVNVYDPILDTWSTSTEIPYASNKLASVTMNNIIYISGGRRFAGITGTRDVYQFDPNVGIWELHSKHLYTRYFHSILTVSNDSINPNYNLSQ